MSPAPLLLLMTFAVNSTVGSPVVKATRVSEGITVDGDLSDPAWIAAKPVSGFRQRYPEDGAASFATTSVRVIYSDKAIYFGFECDDPEPENIVANLARRDMDVVSDAVTIDLDTEGDATRAFRFELSAANVQRDAIRTGDTALSYDWNAVWMSGVRRTSAGWTAEIALPYAALRYSRPEKPTFRVQFRRFIARRAQTDSWVYYPRDVQGEMQRYGVVEGLENLPVSRGIVLEPFVVGRVRSRWAPAELNQATGVDTKLSGGVDARFNLTPGLTLATTVLPDFGQVEADPAMLNLSRFELKLPERRPFFLEGADLFSLNDAAGNPLGTQLFYSRRLGAVPQEAALPAGASVVSGPDVTRLWGAAKLTGRIGSKVSVAVLDGVAASERAEVKLSDGRTVTDGVAPLTNFLVGRLRAPIGGGFTTGLSATHVLRSEGRETLGREGLCPDGGARGSDGRCTSDAVGLAADVNWRSEDGDWLASGLLVGSMLQGGPARTSSDGSVRHPGEVGLGGRIELLKASGKLLGAAVYEVADSKLDLNDAGYWQRQNSHRLYNRVSWRVMSKGSIQTSQTSLESWLTNSWDGVALGRYAQVAHSTTWTNQWSVGGNLGGSLVTYDNRDVTDGTLTERPATINGGFWWNSDWSKPVTAGGWSWARSTWRGMGYGFGSWINARPGSRVSLNLDASWSSNMDDPRYVSATGGGVERRIVMGLQNSTTASTTFRSTFTFTPTMTLQTYAQLFFSSVHYTELLSAPAVGARPTVRLDALSAAEGNPASWDSRNAVLNLNVLFRWEYRPGSVLSLVYSRAHRGGDLPLTTRGDGSPIPVRAVDWSAVARAPVDNVFLAKVSYYWGR